jgi:hypothetical protein
MTAGVRTLQSFLPDPAWHELQLRLDTEFGARWQAQRDTALAGLDLLCSCLDESDVVSDQLGRHLDEHI